MGVGGGRQEPRAGRGRSVPMGFGEAAPAVAACDGRAA